MGGVEKWLHNLSISFISLGRDVFYLNNLDQNQIIDKVNYISFRNYFKFSSGSKNRSLLSILLFSFFVGKWVIKNTNKNDCVYVHQTPFLTIIIVRFISFFKRFTLLTEWIEIWSFKNWKIEVGPISGILGFLLQSFAFRLSHNIITASNLVYEYTRINFRDKKVILLKGQYFHDLPRINFDELLRVKNKNKFLIVSRLSKEKNVNLSIEIFADYIKLIQNSCLTIIGSGPEFSELATLVNSLGLNRNVEFLENINDDQLISHYQNSKYLLHLSRREGYGLVVGEASSFGVIPILVQSESNESVNRCSNFGVISKTFEKSEILSKIIDCDFVSTSKSAFDYFQNNLKLQNVEVAANQILSCILLINKVKN